MLFTCLLQFNSSLETKYSIIGWITQPNVPHEHKYWANPSDYEKYFGWEAYSKI